MKAMKVSIVLVLMFMLTMAAGVVMGRLSTRPISPATQRSAIPGGSPLSDELQLTPEQASELRPIWEVARDTARMCARNAERIQREHEDQLAAMLTDEQKRKYEQLSQANHRRIAAVDAARKRAFRDAVEKTRTVLREDQWQAYEQILKDQVGGLPAAEEEAPTPG